MPEHSVHNDRNVEAEFVRFKLEVANALAEADDNRIRVQQLEEKNRKLEESNEELIEENEQLSVKISRVIAQNERLAVDTTEMANENDELKLKIEEMALANYQLKTRNKTILRQRDELSMKLNKGGGVDPDDVAEAIEQMKEQASAKLKKSEAERIDLEIQTEKLMKERDEWKRKTEDANSANNDMNEVLRRLKAFAKKVKSENSELQTELETMSVQSHGSGSTSTTASSMSSKVEKEWEQLLDKLPGPPKQAKLPRQITSSSKKSTVTQISSWASFRATLTAANEIQARRSTRTDLMPDKRYVEENHYRVI
mmetsp:Transcript_43841/g.64389  ORF Transcript_43841/g.64389 Transcript_43841/m.64389 type:complete len:312 (+) Transcript_43841:116-1051(+)